MKRRLTMADLRKVERTAREWWALTEEEKEWRNTRALENKYAKREEDDGDDAQLHGGGADRQ